MGKKMPIFYNTLLLTGVNLVLRFVSTSFQVYLSGRIGAAGIGLLQLVLSIGALSITAGMGGIRTATMYMCAEVVGQKRAGNMVWILSGCVLYSFLFSISVCLLLYTFAPQIAIRWLGNSETVNAIRILACFLPVNCLCGVMIGHYTGINQIGILAAVEIAEQAFTMVITIILLNVWAKQDATKACEAVILCGGLGACFTLTTLLLLKQKERTKVGVRVSIRKKLWEVAIPLAIADDVKAGISTTENLMVPKRLALHTGEITPLAAFGMVCGMVFPVLMFPAAILYGLTELLIPELARCNASGSFARIRHLAQRSLLLALIYGAFCGGILFLDADWLCQRLYHTADAGIYLRWFAVLAPMLYCDAIVDAVCKGLGQQKICVRFNIITSAMDVLLLFVLLPRYGMQGYFVSFLVTHLINFILSIRLLLKLVGRIIHIHTAVFAITSAVCAVIAGCLLPKQLMEIGYIVVFISISVLLGVVKREDCTWIKGLIAK